MSSEYEHLDRKRRKAIDRQIRSVLQLQRKRGRYYERWREGLALALVREFESKSKRVSTRPRKEAGAP